MALEPGQRAWWPTPVGIHRHPGAETLNPLLAHQALPWEGEQERVVVSFNASSHASQGDRLHGDSAR